MFNIEAFTFWIYICIKEDGAQRDEKDTCYVQTCIYCLKSKIPDYTLQQANVRSACCSENLKKRYHQTIGKLNILGFGGNMFNF